MRVSLSTRGAVLTDRRVGGDERIDFEKVRCGRALGHGRIP
jgi:hypothetical protein